MSSETAIQATPTSNVLPADLAPPPPPRNVVAGGLQQAVSMVASLRVTVTLFALSIVLVLAGVAGHARHPMLGRDGLGLVLGGGIGRVVALDLAGFV